MVASQLLNFTLFFFNKYLHMQLSLCLLHFETKPNSHSFSIMFSYFLFLFKRGYAWNFYFFFVFCQKVRHSRTLQSINFHVCFSRSPVWIFASSAAAWKKNLHAVKRNCKRHKTTVVCQVTDCRFIKMKTVITMNAIFFFYTTCHTGCHRGLGYLVL